MVLFRLDVGYVDLGIPLIVVGTDTLSVHPFDCMDGYCIGRLSLL